MSTLTIKAQSLKFESKTHEAQLEDQNLKESSRMSSSRRNNCKASKWHEKRQIKQNGKEELIKAQNHKNSQNSKLPLKQIPPNTLNASSLP
jgi:hypothetical protein